MLYEVITHYSVDVLGKAERIESVSQLDAKRYGVIALSREIEDLVETSANLAALKSYNFV